MAWKSSKFAGFWLAAFGGAFENVRLRRRVIFTRGRRRLVRQQQWVATGHVIHSGFEVFGGFLPGFLVLPRGPMIHACGGSLDFVDTRIRLFRVLWYRPFTDDSSIGGDGYASNSKVWGEGILPPFSCCCCDEEEASCGDYYGCVETTS